jgi:flavin-dependent dehydrogenase
LQKSYDVVVMGGGPGGSTAATLLARQGWKVALLEKEAHPRFHIGESLLPQNNHLFDELGVREQVERIGLKKQGLEFHSIEHNKHQAFRFERGLDKTQTYGFEVHRAEFDEVLFRNAATCGVETFERETVKQVQFSPDQVALESVSDAGVATQWQCKYVIDATGRDTFLSSRLKTKQPHAKHNSAAMYAHYEGTNRYSGEDEGNISIYWFAHGWFWFIPQTHGITSIGAVVWPYYLKQRDVPLDEFFAQTIALCPPLAERLKDAKRINEVTATGNYSYLSTVATGDRYLLVGDAFAFVDPVFSSGVYLAMTSGQSGANAINACLKEPAKAPAHLAAYEREVRKGIKQFSWFIFRMTNPLMRDLLVNPRNIFGVVDGVLSLFAGDVSGKRIGVTLRVMVFKTIYWISNMIQPRRSLAAQKTRARNIQLPQA